MPFGGGRIHPEGLSPDFNIVKLYLSRPNTSEIFHYVLFQKVNCKETFTPGIETFVNIFVW